MSPVLVIGVGNPWRGDDGAGAAVVRELSDRPGIRAVECRGDPAELMARWAGFERVFLVDAVMLGSAPGTVHRLGTGSPLPVPARHSSHGAGVAEAVELARALGELPRELTLYGIEPGRMGQTAGLSAAVAAAVPQVARCILDELSHPARRTPG